MSARTRFGLAVFFSVALFSFSGAARADVGSSAPSLQSAAPVRYAISLAHPERHLVHVNIALPPGPPTRDLQLPVWNALYQVRDFSQFVNWVRAKDGAGKPLPVRLVNKSRWHINGTENGASVEYEVMANDPGPYGAQLNAHHAFFNLAEILMYPVEARASPVQLSFIDIPPGWRTATALQEAPPEGFIAENYDALVDAPVEMGTFQEEDFDQGGGKYRVVVDADASAYDMPTIVAMVRRVVATATDWMNDRPFDTYLFIYHFPRLEFGGGMEHAYSTAIDVNSQVMATDPQALDAVTAHEFFHLWNVKRIRPQSLEPVDYTKENYSDALWFSEGVTDTVQYIILLRAGLMDERTYLSRMAFEIEGLENRPAHLTQSAEESSLDAWLEKYPAYRQPQRSVSYYNKGDLLGVALDLEIRQATHGAASLRDLFQWLDRNYGRKGRSFPDTDGVRQAAEAVSHTNLEWFFQKYVAGTEEIPWDNFLRTVGLHLVLRKNSLVDLSFAASGNRGAPPQVTSVEPDGEAARAGLDVGQSILEINGRVAGATFRQQLAEIQAGETIHLRVRNGETEQAVSWTVGSREQVEYELLDVDHITPLQRAQRTAWLHGDDLPEASRQTGENP